MTNNLIEAIHRGDTSEMDRQLEGVGVDVNAMDTNGTTALMVASTKGLAKLVKRLLNLGANAKLVDNNGKTSLMAGAMCGDKEVVSALLEAGAGVTIRAQWRGFTALELAGESQQAKERFGGGGGDYDEVAKLLRATESAVQPAGDLQAEVDAGPGMGG